jgi:8-oxo-dGTP diphosphatase
MSDEIQAAGGVVVDDRDGTILVVHRPRYDDWSLPKGHVDPGETFEQAALREVFEETGVRCELHEELEPARYEVKGRSKIVRWWRMSVLEETDDHDDETDEVMWVSPQDALTLLSYEHDLGLVAQVAGS